MKCFFLQTRRPRRGMTLIEVTLVIAVLLSLTSVLFLGATAYKKGTNRAFCIQHIASVQKAVRSYGNLAGLNPGDVIVGLKGEIVGPNKLVPIEPLCPSGGNYLYGGDALPAANIPYLSCDVEHHAPKTTQGW